MGSSSPQPVAATEESMQQPPTDTDKTAWLQELNAYLTTARDEPVSIELEVSGRKAKKLHPSTGVVVSITLINITCVAPFRLHKLN